MQALSLGKGENAALDPQAVALDVTAQGTPLDVSALLLGPNGKVRSDADLVFYHHLSQDGVSLSGHTVTADLRSIPADVDTVVVVASVDPLRPGAVFTAAPVLTVTQHSGTRLTFSPPDFVARETVVVLAELYRRGGGWKVRAVGQGYASGLAGLATDYGVDVEPEPPARPARLPGRTTPLASPNDAGSSLAKVAARAPALLAPSRLAHEALADTGAAGRRAAVYLILDHDWATQELYESLALQTFAERVLALAAHLDDACTVPVIFSSGDEPFMDEIRLDNYRGRIGKLHTQVGWGWGNVGVAMRLAVSHYQETGAADPAFIIVHVGAEPWDKSEFRALLQNTAGLGVFWLFVGFGRGKLAFYKNLNASSSATFTHVAFCEASKSQGTVPDDAFYGGLVDAFGTWLRR
jgi:stress response protein SCP2